MCPCGKHLGTFTVKGLQLYCHFCKETTTEPYGPPGLRQAVAFVESLCRRFRPDDKAPCLKQ
jgi:hypothetical protein